ncbi:hypothetical protein [Nonomuraea longispora]|nr:hypothetical protein [Nonomuraea longispora]
MGQGEGTRTPINEALLRHFRDLRDGTHGRAVSQPRAAAGVTSAVP